VQFNWNASDASGVAQFDLWLRVNNGGWVQKAIAATAKSAVFRVASGTRVQVAVRAKDSVGNWSGFAFGTSVVVAAHHDTSTAMKWTTGWARYTSSSYFGGSEVASATKNAQMTFTFTGRGFAWLSTRAANRGQAYVWVDGVYIGYVDNYAAAGAYSTAVLTKNWNASATHTVTIRVIGTTGRPWIDVDGFAVIS
jgi:hypothetical protein